MKLEKIVTFANTNVRLRFLAMERSLRATGCTLPLLVIPYDENLFDLPPNSTWVQADQLFTWLDEKTGAKIFRKYAALLQQNYQYVDSDVIFLNDPSAALSAVHGFITSCGHWHNTEYTYTEYSKAVYKKNSTTWQKTVFNAGQFACDNTLYTIQKLKETIISPENKDTCTNKHYTDQPGMNLLVHIATDNITNLTLPPYNMPSTWAGDYDTADYHNYWKAQTPYLIHWAGCQMNTGRPIDKEFLKYLSKEELQLWKKQLVNHKKSNSFYKKMRRNLSLVKETIQKLEI